MKKALCTGASGQDASYIIPFLLQKGYEVHGIVRRSSTSNLSRIEHILGNSNVHLHTGDMTDPSSLELIVDKVRPDEVYNLAAQSFVQTSFSQPTYTHQVNSVGVINLLNAIVRFCPDARVYHASTSEMYGAVNSNLQNEHTKFNPQSPYGVSKVSAYWTTLNYRTMYNMFVCNGLMFNHESPRRGIEFVTRKITNSVAKIKLGLQKELRLGNLDAKRDWGFAGDYVEAMWLMLQYHRPDDYVVATGTQYSVRDFVRKAFEYLDLNYEDYVVVDPEFFRPAEVYTLCGDYSKINKTLGWKPKTTLDQLVQMMVDEDLKLEKVKL